MPVKKESTELALVEPRQIARPAMFGPTTFAEAKEFSIMVANSDLAPKDFRDKPANVLIAIQMGAEIGLSPMQALQNIAVINGRPTLWGDAAMGVVQAHSMYEWHKEWIEGEGDKRTAHFQIKRKGQEIHETKFSVADAKRAGIWDKRGREGQPTPWVTYPDRMQQLRARGFGLRDKFADALRGLMTAEEAQDYPPVAVVPRESGAVTEPDESEVNRELRKTAISLMEERGLNTAQREAKLSQYKGRLPELIDRIKASMPAAQQGSETEGDTTEAQPALSSADASSPSQSNSTPTEQPAKPRTGQKGFSF